jgi:anti-anti-sigma factor
MFDTPRPLVNARSTPLPFACAWSGDEPQPGVMSVGGELDIESAPQLTGAFRDAVPPASASASASSVVVDVRDLIVLDLADLTFMDVLGLHAIIDATARAQRLGRRLVLLCGPPAVQRVFTLTGTAAAVEFHDRPAAAASTSV